MSGSLWDLASLRVMDKFKLTQRDFWPVPFCLSSPGQAPIVLWPSPSRETAISETASSCSVVVVWFTVSRPVVRHSPPVLGWPANTPWNAVCRVRKPSAVELQHAPSIIPEMRRKQPNVALLLNLSSLLLLPFYFAFLYSSVWKTNIQKRTTRRHKHISRLKSKIVETQRQNK